MSNFRNFVVGAATALVIGSGSAAWASSITFDPTAANTGNDSGSSFPLYTSGSAFTVTGGTADAYTNIYINPGASGNSVSNYNGAATFNGDMVVNITGFLNGATNLGAEGICASGSGSSCKGWQLFALVTLTGDGSWNGTGSFTAGTISEQIQIYGVNTSGGASGLDLHTNYTYGRPHDGNTTPANDDLTAGQSIGYNDLTGHSGDNPHFNVSAGTAGNINPNNDGLSDGQLACWANAPSGGGIAPTDSNCILLADGTVIADSYSVNTTTLLQSFSLASVLDPEGYTSGTGFFGSDPGDMLLTIDSGQIEGVAGTAPVCSGGDTTGCSPINRRQIDSNDYNANSTCTVRNANDCASYYADHVVWAITIPEPASLAVFGAGLLGVGLIRRRRSRK